MRYVSVIRSNRWNYSIDEYAEYVQAMKELAVECAAELEGILSKYQEKAKPGFFFSIFKEDNSYGLRFGDIYNLVVSDYTMQNTDGVIRLS